MGGWVEKQVRPLHGKDCIPVPRQGVRSPFSASFVPQPAENSTFCTYYLTQFYKKPVNETNTFYYSFSLLETDPQPKKKQVAKQTKNNNKTSKTNKLTTTKTSKNNKKNKENE